MNFKRVIAGIMAFCLMGAIMPSIGGKTADNAVIMANADDYTEGTYEQLKYKNYGDHIEISFCDKLATSVVIPAEIDGVPVKGIGGSVFENCIRLKEITIPDSVTSIEERAFCKCSKLTEITIPDGVTNICDYVFSECAGLTEITIPNSITNIGDSAFSSCTGLTEIIIPNSVTYISEFAFNNCTSLSEITMPDSIKTISYGAFCNCTSLTEITIPDGVTNICDYAFSECAGLTEITIPNSVIIIGNSAFKNCTSLTELIIPDSVTNIGTGVFHGCTGLTEITIPDSVTSIGDRAFYGTPWLESKRADELLFIINGNLIDGTNCSGDVVIPNDVTRIGDSAFKECTDLTEIIIPDSVTEIGFSAFDGCTGLEKITIYNPICEIGNSNFTLSDTATIYGYENSTANEYAKKYNRKMIGISRPKLNYNITESENDKSNIAKSKSVESEINYNTIDNYTSAYTFIGIDKLQECKDSKGNVYAIGGREDSITLFSENTDIKPFTIENDGFTFGAAAIDEKDNLYVLWGYSISEDSIEQEQKKNTENLVVIKYDLRGNVLGRCAIPITTSYAQYPFHHGNASMAVKDNVVGCFLNTKWTNGHQGSEFAAININTMELLTFSGWEGSHSFGVSLIPTDYGFAGIQRGDADWSRGINFNIYFVKDNKVKSNYLAKNGYTVLFSASGQYGTNEHHIDGNNTYLHMGGLAKSVTTYAVVGKSERVYSSMEYYGNSDLRTNNFDVFLKITDQTLAKTASDLAGEERVDVETGETANYNIVWLTECNETEKAGQCKVVTLADGSYCVLWEKFVNGKFDSIRYVITDECGNILRHETGIYGARLSDTSVQPIVDGYTLKWAVAGAKKNCITFYTVDLNEFLTTPIKEEHDETLKYDEYYDYFEVIGCDESATEIIIPTEIDGLPVASIGKQAFFYCLNLESIEIPDSVTSIGDRAFSGCRGLTEITIPDSVTSIGVNAFLFTELNRITILNPNCEIYDSVDTINGTIYGYSNSTAQKYAEKYKRKFVSLDKTSISTNGMPGDINSDGKVDSSDASLVLAEYAQLSTGKNSVLSETAAKLADLNKDGKIDSSDASMILAYYSHVSTGGKDSIEDFLAKQGN